jgi:ATP-dependent RNA helicase DbpA
MQEILSRLDIKELNPMQQAFIEANKNNDNTVLLSNTGTGKTLAYLIPVLALLDKTNPNTQALSPDHRSVPRTCPADRTGFPFDGDRL